MSSITYKLIANCLKIFKNTSMKKLFSGGTEQLMQMAEKFNKGRPPVLKKLEDGQYTYQVLNIPKFKDGCFVARRKQKSERALLYLFGGAMVIGPDNGDLRTAEKFARSSECDLWFPYYPLATHFTIQESTEMILEVYKKMLIEYHNSNISVLGFSSGASLAIGTFLFGKYLDVNFAMPKVIVACSPGTIPADDQVLNRMKELDAKDVLVPVQMMNIMKEMLTHGKEMPKFLYLTSSGDYTGLPPIHFFYGTDELLSAMAPVYETACKKYGIPYQIHWGEGLCHCYPMFSFYPEGKAAQAEIIRILGQPPN